MLPLNACVWTISMGSTFGSFGVLGWTQGALSKINPNNLDITSRRAILTAGHREATKKFLRVIVPASPHPVERGNIVRALLFIRFSR